MLSIYWYGGPESQTTCFHCKHITLGAISPCLDLSFLENFLIIMLSFFPVHRLRLSQEQMERYNMRKGVRWREQIAIHNVGKSHAYWGTAQWSLSYWITIVSQTFAEPLLQGPPCLCHRPWIPFCTLFNPSPASLHHHPLIAYPVSSLPLPTPQHKNTSLTSQELEK